jgi:hypothetical protein
MGPIAYSLCQKPVIGIAMFITNFCAFPPLIYDEPLSTASTSKEFSVPVDKSYFLEVNISANRDAGCQPDSGSELQEKSTTPFYPLQVVITSKTDNRAIISQEFSSSLFISNPIGEHQRAAEKWSNIVAKIYLTRGGYIASIKALELNNCFSGYKITKLTYSLVSGYGK